MLVFVLGVVGGGRTVDILLQALEGHLVVPLFLLFKLTDHPVYLAQLFRRDKTTVSRQLNAQVDERSTREDQQRTTMPSINLPPGRRDQSRGS